MLLVDRPLRDLLAAFASHNPTPGGGSASAVAAAIGASLLRMVAGLPNTRTGSNDERAALAAAAAGLTGVQQQLMEAIDADAAAYDAVVAAYKQPKTTEAERAGRTAGIARALRGATDVPLGVMRLSALGLTHAEAVAAHGHRAAASDVGVAVALLRAGLHGARLNVDINLGGSSDAAYRDAVEGEVARLTRDAATSAAAAERSLGHD
jgi:formiminotetrahydrofolate cyclodeaminase